MGLIFNKVSYFDDVKDVTFCVNDGKITGIIGDDFEDLKIISDLISFYVLPTKGKIIGTYNKIGYVSYDLSNHFFYDNVGEEFCFLLKINHLKNFSKRIEESLKIVGLDSMSLNTSFKRLSLSEKKKISIALALSINPNFIVFFEPLKGLNRIDYDYFVRLILMMKNKYGKTIVIISRDSDLIYNLCDDIILIKDGSVFRTGDKHSIFTDDKLISSCNLFNPKTIDFSKCVYDNLKIDIGYRCDINDLIKDIFRFVR